MGIWREVSLEESLFPNSCVLLVLGKNFIEKELQVLVQSCLILEVIRDQGEHSVDELAREGVRFGDVVLDLMEKFCLRAGVQLIRK